MAVEIAQLLLLRYCVNESELNTSWRQRAWDGIEVQILPKNQHHRPLVARGMKALGKAGAVHSDAGSHQGTRHGPEGHSFFCKEEAAQ